MKKKVLCLLLVMILVVISGCSKASTEESTSVEESTSEGAVLLGGASVSTDGSREGKTVESTVTKDQKFGAATVAMNEEEMQASGFELGDSVDIAFENGYSIEDVPYYNGYYVKNGAPVFVAYPGFSNVSITYNNEGIWDKAKLTDGEKVTITVRESGKYSAIQESLGQLYSVIRDDYDSDEEFCNFRALSGGNLKENLLYRGASPVDNSRGRATYTDTIIKEKEIAFILDLADSDANIKTYIGSDYFMSFYAEGLYNDGKIALCDMGSAYQSTDYQKKLVKGLKLMMGNEGPAYIHCMEGKDRTGFVCMLIEALAGATYDEMLADYMMTYANYYDVTSDGTPEKYNAIAELYFDSFMTYLHNSDDIDSIKKASFVDDAKNYLISGGMTETEVENLITWLTK